jgi:hypothetical protein
MIARELGLLELLAEKTQKWSEGPMGWWGGSSTEGWETTWLLVIAPSGTVAHPGTVFLALYFSPLIAFLHPVGDVRPNSGTSRTISCPMRSNRCQ